MSLTPIIIPVKIDGLRYWTKFEKLIAKMPGAGGTTANQALTLGISIIGLVLGGIVLLAGGSKE